MASYKDFYHKNSLRSRFGTYKNIKKSKIVGPPHERYKIMSILHTKIKGGCQNGNCCTPHLTTTHNESKKILKKIITNNNFIKN